MCKWTDSNVSSFYHPTMTSRGHGMAACSRASLCPVTGIWAILVCFLFCYFQPSPGVMRLTRSRVHNTQRDCHCCHHPAVAPLGEETGSRRAEVSDLHMPCMPRCGLADHLGREMQAFLLGYILISICEIFSVGDFPLSDKVRLVSTLNVQFFFLEMRTVLTQHSRLSAPSTLAPSRPPPGFCF